MKMPFLDEFLSLFFPRVCHSCGKALFMHEKAICTACLHLLPRTKSHLDPESNADQVFWGRVQLEKVSACYYYTRNSKVQRLVHALKYRGMTDVGIAVGEQYGRDLANSVYYRHLDMIIPVPLHPRKLRKRGFNQSEVFARGLSESMGIPVENKQLSRLVATPTQTRRSRFSRWKNVEGIFAVKDPMALSNKKVLLVDDVITTGATIEACSRALQKAENIKLHVAAIALASY
jgi:ComF family protein